MKKTKIQQRVENAFNAFNADENSGENTLDVYRNEFNLRREKNVDDVIQRNGTLETVLKQTLLFFPGTFILYCAGMTFLVFLSEIFTARYRTNLPFIGVILFCLTLAGTLMTWLGLGNIRNWKHFVIPASIFSVGVLWVGLFVVFSIVLEYFGKRFTLESGYLLHFFPLALIVPFLAKGWVDRNSKESETRTK